MSLQSQDSAILGLSLWNLKLVLAAITLVVGVGGVLAPKLLCRGPQGYNLGLSMGNMFSSGVMMGAALVHLLPEAYEHLTEALGPPKEGEEVYPWAMVLLGVGFMITLVPAQLLEPEPEDRQCLECTDDEQALPRTPGAGLLSRGLSGGFESHYWHHREAGHSHGHVMDGQSQGPHSHIHVMDGDRHSPFSNRMDTMDVHSHGHSHFDLMEGHCHGHSHGDLNFYSPSGEMDRMGGHGRPAQQPCADVSSSLPSHLEADNLESGQNCGIEAPLLVAALAEAKSASRNITPVSSLMLTVCLVIHSAMEGIAIGAQAEISASINVAVAVLTHKGLAGYAIGSSLVSSGGVSCRQFITYMMLFSAANPVGILLGGWLAVSVEDAFWAAAVSAISSGTFLYSAVVEVLGNELRQDCFNRDSPHRKAHIKLCKFALFALGYAAMAVISKFT